MSLSLDQSLASNAIDELFHSSVIEKIRRSQWRELEIDVNRVPLICSDAQPIFADREPFLVTGRDDIIEFYPRNPGAVLGSACEQVFDRGPGLRIQVEPN